MNRRLLVDDGRTARELLLVGTMVVGRDPECEISHRDPRLSRRHAEFSIGEHGVLVRDLESRNGIRVNGRVVKEALLQPGDLVQIAQLTVRFVEDDVMTAPAVRRSGASTLPSTLTVASSVEDDRTHVAASGAFNAALAHVAVAAAVTPHAARQVDDDRTRVAGPGAGSAQTESIYAAGSAARDSAYAAVAASRTPAFPGGRRAAVTDLAEVVIRDPIPGERRPSPVAEGVGALARVGWGRRVLLQGLMLALVVFLMALVPLLVWQRQTFGVSAAQSWALLVPPLLASGAAGVLVAALIARTVARGVRLEQHSRR